MVKQVTKDTFLSDYKDDYRDSDNYYQILFNNRKPIQQRELNQMQTILRKQDEAIGRYMFNPGANVNGGAQSIIKNAQYVKLDTTTPYGLPTTGYDAYENEIFTEATSGIKVRIEKVIPAENSDPATLIISFVDDGSTVRSGSPISLSPGRVITGDVSGKSFKIRSTSSVSDPYTGYACIAHVNSGKFFIEDRYVFFAGGNIVLSKYTKEPSDGVGFIVTQDIVTSDDDENLFDNSGATLNRAASGADRHRITLQLALESAADSTDYFIKLCNVVSGVITETKEQEDALATIGDILARRTKEESGDYMLTPMKVHFETNDSDQDNLNIRIGEGVAYVKGYRYENQGLSRFTITKPRSTKSISNDFSVASYGNYVRIETLKGLPDITSFTKVNLRSAVTYGGSTIGTARVRSVEEDGANYRFYLFDVAMNSGSNFGDVRSIGTSTSNYGDILLESTGVANIKDQPNNNAFFELTKTRPKAITSVIITKQFLVNDTSDASGNLTIYPNSGYTFDDATSWITVNASTGAVLTPNITNGGSSASFTGLPNSTSVDILTYQQKANGGVISKTLTTLSNQTKTPLANGDINLGRTDIYQLISVIDSTTSNDITANYTLDNGQRDNYYDVGKLIKKPGTFTPAGNVSVSFKHFTHGSTGDFFAANSYTGQIDYADIPGYRQKNGEVIQLREVLDFRSVKSNTGSTFTKVIPLPRNTDTFNFDSEYYTPKGVVLFLKASKSTPAGQGLKQQTTTSFSVEYPDITPEDTMVVARVILNPYMLDDNDLSIEYVRHKRYTMKDISKIEDRMDKIEELTSLSMLELKTNSIDVLDQNGLNRFKSGITADNFFDHSQSDLIAPDYRASIDTYTHELRPTHNTTAIDLVYDSANSTNTVLRGDNVYISYTDTLWKSQPGASRLVAINELPIARVVGDIKISPASDSWKDTKYAPVRIIQGKDKVSLNGEQNYREWDTNWTGLSDADKQRLLTSGSLSITTTSNTYGNTNVWYYGGGQYVSSTTTTTQTWGLKGDFMIKTSGATVELGRTSIPYMRSRFYSFSITGLRPNTEHFFYFGGQNVSTWVNSASGTAEFTPVAALSRDSVYRTKGNIWSNETAYPTKLGGPTARHITDSNGAISGYFLVPNTDAIRFTTGKQEFLCIDVTNPALDATSTATSFAKTVITAEGILIELEESEIRTRVYEISYNITSNTVNHQPPYEGDHDAPDADAPGGTGTGDGDP